MNLSIYGACEKRIAAVTAAPSAAAAAPAAIDAAAAITTAPASVAPVGS